MRCQKYLPWFLIILFLEFPLGCSTLKNHQINQNKKQTEINLRKKNFIALKQAVANRTLRNGTLAQDLKTKYGPPDNIFYSSSSISSFQVWTYNIKKDKLADTITTPILLYLENDKLVNWKH